MLEKKSSEEAHTSKTFKCGKPYVFAHKFLNSISVEYYISKNGFNCSFYYGTASVTADIVKVLIGPRFLGNTLFKNAFLIVHVIFFQYVFTLNGLDISI